MISLLFRHVFAGLIHMDVRMTHLIAALQSFLIINYFIPLSRLTSL